MIKISKQKEIFNKLAEERLDDITESDEKVNTDNLIYKYKGHTVYSKFKNFDNPLSLLYKIKECKTNLADAKNYQIKLNSKLGEIKKRK